MRSLRRLLPYLRPHAGVIFLAYIFVALLNLTTVIYAGLSGPALSFIFSGDFADVLRTPQGDLRDIWKVLPASLQQQLEVLEHAGPSVALYAFPVLLIAVSVLKGIGQTGQFYLFGRVAQKVLRRLREETLSALLGQSADFFHDHAHGDLLSRLSNDTVLVEAALFRGYFAVARDVLAVIFLLGAVFYTDAKLALLTFITVPLAILPLARFASWLKKVSRLGQEATGDMNVVSHEALAGVRVVQAFGAEARESQRYSLANDRYMGQMLRSYFIRAARTPTMEVLGAAGFAGIVALLAYQVRTQGADPAHYISFLAAMLFMYDPLKKLGQAADHLAMGAAAADRIFQLIDLEPTVRDADDAVELPSLWGHDTPVHFDDVHFAYQEGRPVLRGVSLRLQAGECVALVGSSGSGKTTMANLLPRFFDVPKGGGTIRMGEHDIRSVRLASLRQQISIVGQDTFLFNGSITDNIRYADPTATVEQVLEAARVAHAHEFIEELAHGYDTIVGERGALLSGGQRQRIAIARAVLRNAPVLILDEATSALDVESERHVQEALAVLMQGRTSLVIAHRLSTVRNADRIVVLERGCIGEMGTHEELMHKGGAYAKLYALQFLADEVTPAKDASENKGR